MVRLGDTIVGAEFLHQRVPRGRLKIQLRYDSRVGIEEKNKNEDPSFFHPMRVARSALGNGIRFLHVCILFTSFAAHGLK